MVVRRPAGRGEVEEHWYNRNGALRGLGNAIVPQLAATFIGAVMDMLDAEAPAAEDPRL